MANVLKPVLLFLRRWSFLSINRFTGNGYAITAGLGHNINTPIPALVPLITEEKWVRDVEGLSQKCP